MTGLEIRSNFKGFSTVELFYITTDREGKECIWKKTTEIKDGQERQLQHQFYYNADFHPELTTPEQVHQFLVNFLHQMEAKKKEDVDPDDGFETIFTFHDDAPAGMHLVKIDRNGSRHYEGSVECPKCAGVGLIVHHMENGLPSYNWTDNGVCWKCQGSGKVFGKIIIRTPEYEAVLAERRRKKAEAKEAKHQAELDQIRKNWLIKNGFTVDGFTFLFLGDTFARKEEIKSLGAKFHPVLGWYMDHQVEGFQFLKVSKDQILTETYWGYIIRHDVDVRSMKKAVENPVTTSEYQGQIKDRLKDLHLTVVFTTVFEGQREKQGWNGRSFFMDDSRWFYSFVDDQGNCFTWTASNPAGIDTEKHFRPLQKGDKCTLTGTVKDHKEYKGTKQTVLTRCKIQGIE